MVGLGWLSLRDGEELVPFWPPIMDACEEALDPSCTDLEKINGAYHYTIHIQMHIHIQHDTHA